ncbi:MAG: 50S ribosomal protein L9 [Pseudomonadota bacterium]|nr:50S ribosomal protein L9 [Pseudomonadota bacterium]
MEVILLERIDRLGQMGQVVKVRPGFARNFLLPQNKALRATKTNMEVFEKQRAQLEARNAAERSKAQTSAADMDKVTVTIIRQASETGQLYGSVTARDIAEAAKEGSHSLDRNQVQIDTPIKTLGLFPIKIKLHPEVTVKITVNVARSPEEAVVQAQKGAAVLKASDIFKEEGAEVAPAASVEGEAEAAPEAKKTAKKAKSAKTEDMDDADAAPKAKKPRAKKASAE